MSPRPIFTPGNTTPRYELRFHFGWYSHGRQPLFVGADLNDVIRETWHEVTSRYGYHVLEHAVEPTVMRALLSLRPDMAPSSVTKAIKGNLSARIRERLNVSQLWSRGWFFRGNGHVTNDIVRDYIAGQYEQHRATPAFQPERVELAKWHYSGNCAELRRTQHAVFEYNVHFVFVTRRRYDFLDLTLAELLVEYLRRVCKLKEWIAWDIEIIWNHVHCFLGLKPTDAAGDVALSLMNNSAYFLQCRYSRAIEDAKMGGVWQPSYYAGTAGSATTAMIKAYLRNVGEEAPTN